MPAPTTYMPFDAALPFSRRWFIAATSGLIVTAACSSLPKSQRKTVLFVCEFGTAKSVIAREMFRRRAADRNIAVFAFSRGLVIEDHITPGLRRNLAADGIDPYSEPFKVLQPTDWSRASVVVAFNPLPKTLPKSKVRDWDDVPSVVSQYPAARAALGQRIDALLDEFAVL
jgi:arsenate reductase (thioredoxin)